MWRSCSPPVTVATLPTTTSPRSRPRAGRRLRVVTSDAELAERVRRHGAEVVGAGAFRDRLEALG